MLQHYTYALAHLNRNKLRGEVAPHKPVLLLALIDYIDEKMRTAEGRAELNLPIPFKPTLESKFKCAWNNIHHDTYPNQQKLYCKVNGELDLVSVETGRSLEMGISRAGQMRGESRGYLEMGISKCRTDGGG